MNSWGTARRQDGQTASRGDACVARTGTSAAGRVRRLRLLGITAALMLVLAGCAASPEASRVRGESGADVGNHGNPIELLAPPDRFERVYFDTPFDGPRIAKPDTSLS